MGNDSNKGFLKRFLPMTSISLNSRLGKIVNAIEEKNTQIVKLSAQLEEIRRIAAENEWANIFNLTIEDSQWLKHRSFSTGRWALGYPAFYALYRTLNVIHPKNILDLGLGQSSWLIAQYAAANEVVSHTIVEHDPEWIAFFTREHKLPENSKIVQLDYNITEFKGASVREYGGFSETFNNKQFDMILIDEPFGLDMKEYARIDVLKMMPGILEQNFVILIDDTERFGEKNTINKMKAVLNENNTAFSEGTYSGIKTMTILCAESLKFLTSM